MTTRVSMPNRIALRQAAYPSPLLQLAVIRGPRVLVQCTAADATLSLTIASQRKRWMHQTRVTPNKHVGHCTSKFYKLSGPTGSDWRQLSDKIISLYKICKLRITNGDMVSL